MNKIVKGPIVCVIARPLNQTVSLSKREEDSAETPFARTNRVVNRGVNSLASVPLRMSTPVLAMVGGYRKAGMLGGAGGLVAGLATGVVAAGKDVVVGVGSLACIPSVVALDGASYENVLPRVMMKDETAAKTARRTGFDALLDLTSHPATRPLDVFATDEAPKEERTAFSQANRDLAIAANRMLTLPARILTPFVAFYSAARAYDSIDDKEPFQGFMTGCVAAVGATLNALVLGAPSDVAVIGYRCAMAAIHGATGLVNTGAALCEVALAGEGSSPEQIPATRTSRA